MNLGQAVAICLYELAREPRGVRPLEMPSAKAAALERITEALLESLQLSGYLKTRSEAASEEKIRRMVRRLSLSDEDAETVLGMLRKMIWKMKVGR